MLAAMPVFKLDERLEFPPADLADDGLLAVGGDLSPERLVLAYSRGIFPWYEDGLPILWHSPDPRMVLEADQLRVPRSLRKTMQKRPYRLTRMLTQLRQAGVLARARGLIFGEMRGCDEPGGKVTAVDAIREATQDFHGPILYGFPSGHTTGPCWTLPLGALVRAVGATSPAVVIEEAAVEPAHG